MIRRADGSEVPILGSAAPIRDAQGHILGAVGVFQDLSERMRLQRAVRENERLLEAVFELLPSGVCITDAGGRVIRGNRAGKDLWRGGPGGPEQGTRKGWWVDSGQPIAPGEWPGIRALAAAGHPCGRGLVGRGDGWACAQDSSPSPISTFSGFRSSPASLAVSASSTAKSTSW